MELTLNRVVEDFADSLAAIDSARLPFRAFMPGVGPYGEPQLLKLVAQQLSLRPAYAGKVITKRTPDLLIKDHWALECKIVRPYGNNGELAENWSVNLLHPYEGNVSLLSDCLKLRALDGFEKKAVIAIGYEHTPPQVNLDILLQAFELIAKQILNIDLGERIVANRQRLVHPVHQQLFVCGWEVLSD